MVSISNSYFNNVSIKLQLQNCLLNVINETFLRVIQSIENRQQTGNGCFMSKIITSSCTVVIEQFLNESCNGCMFIQQHYVITSIF